MSRSVNTDRTPNPAKRFLKWDSDSKSFKYWDKELPHATDSSKKGANVLIPLPFQFLVLDTLHTITGFSDADQAGIYSNEIRDIKKQVLSVKIGKTEAIRGLYDDIKGKVSGANYAQSVYIAFFDKDSEGKKSLVIGNLKLTGASLGPWIDFCKTHKPTEGAIKVVTTTPGKKGKVTWDAPVFEAIAVKPETDTKAMELDGILQNYLKEYFDAAKVESSAAPMEEVEGATKTTYVQTDITEKTSEAPVGVVDDFEDDLPF